MIGKASEKAGADCRDGRSGCTRSGCPRTGRTWACTSGYMKEGVVEELRRGRSLSMFHSSDFPTLNRRLSNAAEHGLGYAIRDFLGRKVPQAQATVR